MKFLHLGDLHLGKSLGEFDLIDDQEYILSQILDVIENEKIDAVLIAGDIYDKAVPSEAATNLLDWFLNKLSKTGAKTFIISGNHDSDDRLNYGSSLFESNNIFISSKFNGNLLKQSLEDEYGAIDIYLLPFVKASQVKHYFPKAKIESYDDAVRTVIKEAKIDKDNRNIILAHQFVAGKKEDPVFAGSENIGTKSVGLVEKIGYDCFDEFDYVALGHIHSPQKIGREEVRYSGSPLKYSLSETNNSKSVPVITMKNKGDVEIELIPLNPKRDLRHIKGKMKTLLSKENIKETEDFIYVTLTDEEIVDNAMGIFQQTYPNTVRIDYDNSHTHEIEHIDFSKIGENKSFEELIEDFYRLIYGTDMTDEEMDCIRGAAREAGILDEAN